MFKKVLVANRGEIALRVICACKELDIPTVAIYSEADRDSLHVRFADEAVCVGPAQNYESYLNIPAVISAAEITNVDAIHPGYGFLAESSYFAEVCQTCRIKFIGPAPRAIELMGDKARARSAMAAAGLPILPGSECAEGDFRALQEAAERIGYPVIIKAAAGGGGRGMRIVAEPAELKRHFETAQSEAQKAFGSAAVYLEKYLQRPRHVEFQVLADEHGNTVHLGERECSIQRRHQKLLEEAPSVIMTPESRSSLGSRIVEAIRNVGYSSAGTVEFLFDEDMNYYFIEMNTRIQVEHGVTEMLTGIDLVKEQIRIAAGETLSVTQQDIAFRGHCIECRINAESPENFAPSPGKIVTCNLPTGVGIRVDSVIYTDYTLPPYYDSLVAKLLAHGRDRDEAIRRMIRALDMFIIEGIQTSIPLHRRILADPDFVSGNIDTTFMERWIPSKKS